MEWLEFSRRYNKMCDEQKGSCKQCPMWEAKGGDVCAHWVLKHPEIAEQVISGKTKTRRQDLLDKYPKAKFDDELGLCCETLGMVEKCGVECGKYKSCDECWDAPLE